jgi:hypothetical protein
MPQQETKSYLVRHWNGQLSLPISFFINGFLGNIVAVVLATTVTAATDSSSNVWAIFFGITGTWAAVITITLWQLVGVWRSATNHPERGGSSFWAGVAKFMVIVGALQTVFLFSQNALPQIAESIKIVRGDHEFGPHWIRVLNNGQELEFGGGIVFGVAEDLERAIVSSGSVHTIHLDSHGGRINEAEKLQDVIRRYQLNTYVSRECLSACTIAFLGGDNRYIHPRGRLGFHAASIPGVSQSEIDSQVDRVIEIARSLSVDESFLRKAYLSHSQDFWYPSTDELIQSGFVTDVANGQFSISGLGAKVEREDIEAELETVPIYKTLSHADPNTFRSAVDIYYHAAQQGEVEGAVNGRVRALVAVSVAKFAPFASDSALLNLFSTVNEQLSALASADASVCVAYLYPDRGGVVNFENYFSPELLKREMDVMNEIVRTGDDGAAPQADAGVVDKVINDLLSEFSMKFGEQALRDLIASGTPSGSLSDDKICDVSRQFYGLVISLPEGDREKAIRVLLSSS